LEIKEIPFLMVILHPFKESHSITLGKKEVLFGVLADDNNPKKEVKTLKFVFPITLFTPWMEELATTKVDPQTELDKKKDPNKTKKTTTTNQGMQTPSFLNFFDKNFIKGNPQDEPYQPRSNQPRKTQP
jgi:hypothetical protein